MKYAYIIHWTMRPHKFEWWSGLSAEERADKMAKRQKDQEEAMKKHGFKLDFWGPAWGADHDYVTVLKSDKAWDEMSSFMPEFNQGWIKTKCARVEN